MKIIYTITRMVIGGAQETAKHTAEYFHQQGHDVLFVTGEEAGREGHYDVDAPTLTMPSMVRAIRPHKDLITLYRLYRLFRKEKPDIVHARTAKARFLTAFAGRLAGVKVLVQTMHGWSFNMEVDNKRWMYVLAEKMATRFYDWTVMVAESDIEEGRRIGMLEKKVSIIRSGVNVDRMRNIDQNVVARYRAELAPNDATVFVLVGRLSPPKTPEVFVEAAALLAARHPKTRFVIVGDGVFREPVEALVEERGLRSRVVLLGLRRDAAEIVAASDVVVHSSTHEGLPKTILEGMAAGKPVIGTDVDGVSIVLQNGVNGLLIPKNDPAALASAMERLLTDHALRVQLSRNASTHVVEFSLVKTIQDTEALYERLLQAAK
ncbi:MAG TPA: glycosyltransferase family 4 protein [Thermoanaerobaculia bacterium]|jgi:glycosyltransferase involved in cell wall biosynthesis|nr:glycosyltransferase family 4 protein [Thermoanaerobaculia bacterium]